MQTLLRRTNEVRRNFLRGFLHRIAPEEKEPLADDLAALVVRRIPRVEKFSQREKLVLLSCRASD